MPSILTKQLWEETGLFRRRREGLAGRPHPVDIRTLKSSSGYDGQASGQKNRQHRPGAHGVSAKLAEAPPLAAVAPLGPGGRPISLQTLGPKAEGRKGDIAVVLRPRRKHT